MLKIGQSIPKSWKAKVASWMKMYGLTEVGVSKLLSNPPLDLYFAQVWSLLIVSFVGSSLIALFKGTVF